MFAAKKIVAGLLMTLYLSTFSVAAELLRLPNLLIHFIDHREDGRPLAVTNFVWEHYFVEDGSDSDADEDAELPFNSTDHFTSTFSPVLGLPLSVEYDFSKSATPASHFDRYKNPKGSLFDPTIWQPPRIA